MIRKKLLESYVDLPDYKFLLKYRGNPKIYVRFSEYAPSFKTIIRSKNTQHKDPTGIYAFPLEYVLKNYSNQSLNIFFSMPYVIILEDKSENKFILGEERTVAEWYKIFDKMNINFKKIGKHLSEIYGEKEINNYTKLKKTSTKIADPKIFFAATQLSEKGEVVSGDTQRLRWIKAGFDALEDTGYGIVNNQEPYQIIFLKEEACDIIDYYNKIPQLKRKASQSQLSSLILSDPNKMSIEDYAANAEKENAMIQYGQVVIDKLCARILQEALSDVVVRKKDLEITKQTIEPRTQKLLVDFSTVFVGKKYSLSVIGRFAGYDMEKTFVLIHIILNKTKQPIKKYQFILSDKFTIDDAIDEVYIDFSEDSSETI